MSDKANCTICGSAVDTREIEDGGAPDGCELASGKWACSRECYLEAHIYALEAENARLRGEEEALAYLAGLDGNDPYLDIARDILADALSKKDT